jgi:hypothetical protein
MRTFARIGLGVPALLLTLLAAAPAGATVYLSPNGNDGAPCTQAAPCKTFDRGYRVSPAGGDVELAGGTYGGQSLTNLPVKPSAAKVVFRPAAGASVRIGYLDVVNSDNIEVRSMATGGWGLRSGAAHVILRDLTANDLTQAAGYFSGSDDIQIIGGEIARTDPNDGIHMNNGSGSNTNIVIDGLLMHDLTINRDSTSHNDCIQTGDVTNLTIRNSRFVNCGTQGVFLNPYNGGATRNVLIENSWFGKAQLGYNVLYVGDAVGVTVRNNSFTGQVTSYNPASFTHLKMVNNIFAGNDSYNCGGLASKSEIFDYNQSSGSCGSAKHHTASSAVASQFTSTSNDASVFDLHLKAGAPAIDKGSPTDSAANDYDGQARPIGGAPDAGADEYGTGPLGPPSSGGGTPPPAGGGDAPGTGGGAPPATGSTPAGSTPGGAGPSAVAAVLASLPAAAAAALRQADSAKAGSKAPLTAAGIDDGQICRKARKGCVTTTALHVVLTKATKVRLVFRKVRPGQRAKIVRTTTVRLKRGAHVLHVRARGLGKGRYHLVLRTTNGATADVPLRVA